MSSQPSQRWFQAEQVGAVTVVRFPHQGSLSGEAVPMIGEELFHLVADLKQTQLVLNLSNVDGVDSAMVGKLVALQKKALAAGGRVALCHVSPELFEIFETVKLPRLIGFYRTEDEAIRTF